MPIAFAPAPLRSMHRLKATIRHYEVMDLAVILAGIIILEIGNLRKGMLTK
jgi:hypothetical protein